MLNKNNFQRNYFFNSVWFFYTSYKSCATLRNNLFYFFNGTFIGTKSYNSDVIKTDNRFDTLSVVSVGDFANMRTNSF